MSFPLKNFEAHLPKDILKKGKDYWDGGNVNNLAQDGNTRTAGVWQYPRRPAVLEELRRFKF